MKHQDNHQVSQTLQTVSPVGTFQIFLSVARNTLEDIGQWASDTIGAFASPSTPRSATADDESIARQLQQREHFDQVRKAQEEERLSMQLISQMAHEGEILVPAHPAPLHTVPPPPPSNFVPLGRVHYAPPPNNPFILNQRENSYPGNIPTGQQHVHRVTSVPPPERLSTEDLTNQLLAQIVLYRGGNLRFINSQSLHHPAPNVQHMPVHTYTKKESNATDSTTLQNQSSQADQRCSICLSDYETGDVVKTLPCFHMFHQNCIDAWLRTNDTCPICKYQIT